MNHIYALKFGESTIAESQVYQDGDRAVRVPISFTMYLIKTENRLILVDAGCYTMPDFEMRYFCGPRPLLLQLGIDPTSITDVILTHAHHDHVEAVGEYTNATVYLQRHEYEEAKPYLHGIDSLVLFDEEYDLLDGIHIQRIGGHSIGSCIVKVQTECGEFVIVGDECYARDCLTKGLPIGSAVDREASNRFLAEYRSSNALLCHENILVGQNGILNIV